MCKSPIIGYRTVCTKIYFQKLEAVVQRCSVKKVFLEILQNSQENTCARVSFLIRLWHRRFPINFVKFLRKSFYIEHLWWLLLILDVWQDFEFRPKASYDFAKKAPSQMFESALNSPLITSKNL